MRPLGENCEIKAKVIIPKTSRSTELKPLWNPFQKDKAEKLIIRRYPVSDQYNIRVESNQRIPGLKHELTINNGEGTNRFDESWGGQYLPKSENVGDVLMNNSFSWETKDFHRSKIKKDFLDTNSFTYTTYIDNVPMLIMHLDLIHHEPWWDFNDDPYTLDFTSIKQITLTYDPMKYYDAIMRSALSRSSEYEYEHTNNRFGAHEAIELTPKVKIDYSHIIFDPLELDRMNPMENACDLYVGNFVDDIVDEDINATDMKLINPCFDADNPLKLKVVKDINKDKKINGVPYYGYLKVAEPTHYNYEKGTVERGYGDLEKAGELIPYNHKGHYDRLIMGKLNAPIYKLWIHYQYVFDDPILDPDEGIVNLECEEDKKPQNVEYKYLSESSIRKMQGQNTTFNRIVGMLRHV